MPRDHIINIVSPDEFASLCQKILVAEYPDFDVIDDSAGDGGNDGYSKSAKILWQLYCPEKDNLSIKEQKERYQSKIRNDLKKAQKLRDEKRYLIDTWIFTTTKPLTEDLHTYLRTKATEYNFSCAVWSSTKLHELLSKHEHVEDQFPHLVLAKTHKLVEKMIDNQQSVAETKAKGKQSLNSAFRKRIDEARDRLNSGSITSAKDSYKRILEDMSEHQDEIEPHLFFRAKNNLATCEHHLGNNAEAAKLYREAFVFSPSDRIAIINQAVALMLEENAEEAIAYLDKISSDYSRDDHYITIRCNCLKLLGRYADLYKYLEPLSKPKLLLTFKAFEQQDLGNYKEALRFFEEVLKIEPNNREALEGASQCSLFGYKDELRNGTLPEYMLRPELREVFRKAEDWIKKLIEIYKSNNETRMIEAGYTNLAATQLAQSNYVAALQSAQKALEYDPTSMIAWQNKGICELKLNNYKDCLHSIRQFVTYGGEESALAPVLAMCAREVNDHNLAIEYGEKYLYIDGVIDTEMAEVLIEVYANNLDTDKVERILSELQNTRPNDCPANRIVGDFYSLRGMDGALFFLEKAVASAQNPTDKMLAEVSLADHYFKNAEYLKSADLYKKYIDRKGGRFVTLKYLRSLYRSGRYGQLLAEVSDFEEDARNIEQVLELEAHTNLTLQNVDLAATKFKKLYSTTGNINYVINYGLCEIRQKNQQKAKSAYDAAKSQAKDRGDWMPLAQGYAALGDWVSALELIQKSYEQDPHDPEIMKTYIWTFLFSEQASDIKRSELHIKTFQEISTKYGERFPDENDLRSIKIEGDDITPILEMIRSVSENAERYQTFYAESKAPLSFVPKATGRNPLIIWNAFTADKQTGIQSNFGSEDETRYEKTVMEEQRALIMVVDIYPLLLLNATNTLEKVLGNFEKIYVHQSVIDSLNSSIDQEKLALKNGHKTIGYSNGQYVSTEISSDQVATFIESTENLIRKIKGLPNLEIRGFSSETDAIETDFLNNLHATTKNSVYLAAQLKIPLYTDDKIVRAVIKSDGIKSVSTYNLLTHLAVLREITNQEYHTLHKRMLELGYSYIPINANMIFYEFMKDLNPQSLEVYAKNIAKKETTLSSINLVLSEFLLFLLAETRIPNHIKKDAFKKLISEIRQNHDIKHVREGIVMILAQNAGNQQRDFVERLLDVLLENHQIL